MVKKLFGLFCGIILAMCASVFTSCDKQEEIFEAPQVTNPVTEVKEPQMTELRALYSGYYTAGQSYKDNFSNIEHWHGVAAGFASWWNCIVDTDGVGRRTTVDQILSIGEGKDKLIDIRSFPKIDSRIKFKIFKGEDEQETIDDFEYYLRRRFDGGAPCLVLFKDRVNTNNSNALVIVLSYKDGIVYYYTPFTGTLEGMDLDQFVSYSIAASSSRDRVNVITWNG